MYELEMWDKEAWKHKFDDPSAYGIRVSINDKEELGTMIDILIRNNNIVIAISRKA